MKRKRTKVGQALDRKALIDDAIARGMKAVQELDVIVREKFRDDPAAIAEWEEAIRIDPPQRRSARAETPLRSPKRGRQ